jgi:hypothetical protein
VNSTATWVTSHPSAWRALVDRLAADLVEFMTTISVLEEFDAGLCAAVTGDTNAEGLHEELVSGDLFVVQVDHGGARFRFHHLFGAFLRARLRRLGADRLRDTQERAITALEDRGEHLAALRLAMASGDTGRAAGIVTTTISMSLAFADKRVRPPPQGPGCTSTGPRRHEQTPNRSSSSWSGSPNSANPKWRGGWPGSSKPIPTPTLT